MTIGETASANVAEYLLSGKPSDRVALRMLNRDHTYGELQEAAAAIAGHLVNIGLAKGDRAILLGDNSLFWVAAYLGTLQAGIVSVPLAIDLAPEDLDSIQKTTDPRAVLVESRLLKKYHGLFRAMHLVTDTVAPPLSPTASQISLPEAVLAASHRRRPQTVSVDPDDLAALMFTSGSTGIARGVMISHGNIIANTTSILEYLRLSERDRIMAVLPFHYCFGTSLLHTHLRVGGSLAVDSRFLYPEAVLQRMQQTECTGFAGVPSHFQILLRKSNLFRTPLPHLRYVQQAGGCLAPAFIRDLRRALPHTEFFVMYGQTEATARLSYLPPEFLDSKIGSIGKGIPGVRLAVLNDAGGRVAPGETGEIVAEGANVARGYWKAPEESAASFRNGKLYTGDLATIDQDGFIYVVGRAKNMIKCGGERVSCRRIEEEILACDEVEEVAVTGMPDEILGEAIQAFIVARRAGSPSFAETVQAFCRRRLPPRLVPRRIFVLPRLPKNSAGKVLRSRLQPGSAGDLVAGAFH